MEEPQTHTRRGRALRMGCLGLALLPVLAWATGHLLPAEVEIAVSLQSPAEIELLYPLIATAPGVTAWWSRQAPDLEARGYPPLRIELASDPEVVGLRFLAGERETERWRLLETEPPPFGYRPQPAHAVWEVAFSQLSVERRLELTPIEIGTRLDWTESATLSNPLLRWMHLVMPGERVRANFRLALGALSSEARERGARSPLGVGAGGPELNGTEGFFDPWAVSAADLSEQGLELEPAALGALAQRVGKLILPSGRQFTPPAELAHLERTDCADPDRSSWNQARCSALARRACDGPLCAWDAVGNCSAVLLGDGRALTAAHCVASLGDDPAALEDLRLVLPDAQGAPGRTLLIDAVERAKDSFQTLWVSVGDPDAMDVALLRFAPIGLPPIETAPLPDTGAPLFILGFPRLHGRDEAAMASAGYGYWSGTPGVSFGRLVEPNPLGWPLCSPTGRQEDWAIALPCRPGPAEGGETAMGHVGPISVRPFLASYDSTNGYSGGPVFDAQGRLLGVNYTLVSETDPQERFDPSARMVATPIEAIIERFGLP